MSVFNENGVLVKPNTIDSIMEDFKLLQNNISGYDITYINESFSIKKIWQWVIDKLTALKNLVIKAFNMIKNKFKKYDDTEINDLLYRNASKIIDEINNTNKEYILKDIDIYDFNDIIKAYKYVDSMQIKDYKISTVIHYIASSGTIIDDGLFTEYFDNNNNAYNRSKFINEMKSMINSKKIDINASDFINKYYLEFKKKIVYSKSENGDYVFKLPLLMTTNHYNDGINECKKYINTSYLCKPEYLDILKGYLNRLIISTQMYLNIVDDFSDMVLKMYSNYNRNMLKIAMHLNIELK